MRSVPPAGSRSIPDTVSFAPPVPRRGGAWGAVVAASLVGASAAILVVMTTGMGEKVVERIVESPGTTSEPIVTVSTTAPVQGAAEAVAAAMPSVAQITVTSADATTDASAVVIRADGYLVTDAGAVEGAITIAVSFADGTTETGAVVAVDPLSELAVIRVPRHDLAVAEFGDPATLQVGQQAMALGSHQDGGPSISSGVISALGQRSTSAKGTALYGMIRFDAPVPTEVAGGPLVTDEGTIVGITVKSSSDSAFGWATPIDEAREIADDLITTGHASHAWLGVEGRRSEEGPVVSLVVEGSPAANAGLQAGDVLLRVDGEALASMSVLASIIRDREPGDSITIAYTRNGMEWTCVATLGERS
jgi:putative serine protease PepD